MLLLAFSTGISGDARIFKIDLDLLQWLTQLFLPVGDDGGLRNQPQTVRVDWGSRQPCCWSSESLGR